MAKPTLTRRNFMKAATAFSAACAAGALATGCAPKEEEAAPEQEVATEEGEEII